MSESNNSSDLQLANKTCPAVGYQTASITVPVTVTPFAHAGTTRTYCCGDPVVCSGTTVCAGTLNGSCCFTITQDIKVAIPVEFGANAVVGAPSVVCGEVTSEEICTNCEASGIS